MALQYKKKNTTLKWVVGLLAIGGIVAFVVKKLKSKLPKPVSNK